MLNRKKSFYLSNLHWFTAYLISAAFSSYLMILISERLEIVFDSDFSAISGTALQTVCLSMLFMLESYIRNNRILYRTVEHFSEFSLDSFLKCDYSENICKKPYNLNYRIVDLPQWLIEHYHLPVMIMDGVIRTTASVYALFRHSDKIAILAVALTGLYFVLVFRVKDRLSVFLQKHNESYRKLEEKLTDVFRGIRSVKLLCAEEKAFEELQFYNQTELDDSLTFRKKEYISFIIPFWSGRISIPFLILISSYHIRQSNLNPGELIAGVFLLDCLITNLLQAGEIVKKYEKNRELHNELMKNCSSNSSITEIEPLSGEFRMNKVNVGYIDRNNVLKDLNLMVFQGEKIAVTGKHGSGKSTLLKLISGMIRPFSGDLIYLGNRQGKLSFFNQTPILFNMSIRDNLVLDNKITDSEIMRVIEKVCLKERIERNQEGIDAVITPGFHEISAGEAARMEIARILLESPDICLLDEFSANIDTETENFIYTNFSCLKNTTVIAVSHRKSTIAKFNRVIVLDDGKIDFDGSYEQYLAFLNRS